MTDNANMRVVKAADTNGMCTPAARLAQLKKEAASPRTKWKKPEEKAAYLGALKKEKEAEQIN